MLIFGVLLTEALKNIDALWRKRSLSYLIHRFLHIGNFFNIDRCDLIEFRIPKFDKMIFSRTNDHSLIFE